MSTVKDYFKSIGITTVTILITLLVTGAFNYPEKVNERFNKAKQESFEYTDKEIAQHELTEAVRDEMFKLYLDERFDGLEKLIKANNKRQ